jgi:hypothetical protein
MGRNVLTSHKQTLRKWNEEKGEYEPYDVPSWWRVSRHETDMDTAINCAQCGRMVDYGKSYTSLQVHDEAGFGYMVCGRCHDREVAEREARREALEAKRDRETRLRCYAAIKKCQDKADELARGFVEQAWQEGVDAPELVAAIVRVAEDRAYSDGEVDR